MGGNHGNIQQAVSRARLTVLQVVIKGNDFLEKEHGLGVSKELIKPVAFQQPDNTFSFPDLEEFPSQTYLQSV